MFNSSNSSTNFNNESNESSSFGSGLMFSQDSLDSTRYGEFENEAVYIPQSSQQGPSLVDQYWNENTSLYDTANSTFKSDTLNESISSIGETSFEKQTTQDFFITSQDIFSSSQFNYSQDENNQSGKE
ncbi:unnamed protein product [Brachionus calyciflorus]|uniref:Uncharacterized protein n=1 Tax=Brachionus calyciflorus TaxID=104777 RepID=A0A814CRJ9_9BILA|nr:unnamed protein product [Brachionus calyciflorus]